MNVSQRVFYLVFEMTVEERDFTRMSENVKAKIWAATHRLGQMRSLLMHEKHKVWKREFGFDGIETAAVMDEKRSRTSTSPVPNPFFYRNMVISSHPHTPDEFALEMKVDVEGLRMEIILSQPASSHCDPSPRRAAVDTGSEEPGTPQQPPAISTEPVEPGTPPQSPAIRTGSPGASQAATQMEEEISPFEASMDGFLNQNFTSTEQESALLHQQDVGVDDDEKETTTTTQQVAVRKEFVSPTEKQQQRGTTAWGTEQHKLFNRGRPFAMQLIF